MLVGVLAAAWYQCVHLLQKVLMYHCGGCGMHAIAGLTSCLCVLQVREKEADIDSMIAPIEDMCSLLLRYEVSDPNQIRHVAPAWPANVL